jgi:hypothetical protein
MGAAASGARCFLLSPAAGPGFPGADRLIFEAEVVDAVVEGFAGGEAGLIGVGEGDDYLLEQAVSSTPMFAAPRSLEEQLYAIGAEVRDFERALIEARLTIETQESELAGWREMHEQDVSTIRRLEDEGADRSLRVERLREKIADIKLAIET